ncbi:fumarylacetoacetate hydrolase family protein [Hyphomonas johnsonii]|uniref:Fumarylacetoacetate hydrolase family protein n=1 Tax=Hyphomonas johnsonii MHS-2 TaxID=1280950 RepID=A0A059FFL0_9PROT|nr:fumarylacetoacetate hydrolase family protein [Hyphomonas johnsonii]KCZ89404.1 fumarylacetoacetate hydrolase family protein [Hyphomonas johnsonii MHS-2]
MRLARFERGKVTGFGVLQGEAVVPLAASTFEAALRASPSGDPLPLATVRLLAPVEKPGKILGIGVNYAAHAAESVSFVDTKKPEVQKWFNKQVTAVNAPYANVDLPIVSDQLDYEGELVVVIGKRGRHVPRERALEIVAGVTVGCDYSVRDWQRASQTMIMGKGFDTHAVFGPAIVTLDEIPDLGALEVRTYVNGEQRQSGHVRDQIHDIAAQIAHLTAAFTLEPGDVIFTGTPAGVGAGHTPPKWLKAGDRVRVEIDGLGHTENEIVREAGETVIG